MTAPTPPRKDDEMVFVAPTVEQDIPVYIGLVSHLNQY